MMNGNTAAIRYSNEIHFLSPLYIHVMPLAQLTHLCAHQFQVEGFLPSAISNSNF